MNVPNPGSDAAISAGCTCPVSDNRRGEGLMTSTGRMFWFSEGCLLHDAADAGREADAPRQVEGEGS